ncbi:hypothetical protein EMWEY_00042860 [Eimeria maxima]|uniref:Uncharacterized protein n=1 Tax=Eimeria maxima TaxID=5804 RepID=U6MGM9_EIMMA|nr:hypothetical protein EMWEY_00042860 [Eimeria maxima]CDJ61599.1 hypothetical protein EMWEY_00042860 [Eimeria maxima]
MRENITLTLSTRVCVGCAAPGVPSPQLIGEELGGEEAAAKGEKDEFVGLTEQEFTLGKHPVLPLNFSLYGICPGETRRLGIRIK